MYNFSACLYPYMTCINCIRISLVLIMGLNREAALPTGRKRQPLGTSCFFADGVSTLIVWCEMVNLSWVVFKGVAFRSFSQTLTLAQVRAGRCQSIFGLQVPEGTKIFFNTAKAKYNKPSAFRPSCTEL